MEPNIPLPPPMGSIRDPQVIMGRQHEGVTFADERRGSGGVPVTDESFERTSEAFADETTFESKATDEPPNASFTTIASGDDRSRGTEDDEDDADDAERRSASSAPTPASRTWLVALGLLALLVFALCVTVVGLLASPVRVVETAATDDHPADSQRLTEVPTDAPTTEPPTAETTAPVAETPTETTAPVAETTASPSGAPFPTPPPSASPTAAPELERCRPCVAAADECGPLLRCEVVDEDSRYLDEDCPDVDLAVGVAYCLHPAIVPTSAGAPVLCHGDCDSDGDCGPGLVCHQRAVGFEPVPGCRGGATDESRNDYCVVGPDFLERAYGPAVPGPSLAGRCERCEADDDCDVHLVCAAAAESSGCGDDGDASPKCAHPRVRDFGGDPLRNRYPFSACSGDCDEDHDCAPGLRCRGPDGDGRLPGCVGEAANLQYCVVIPEGDLTPTEAPYSLPTADGGGGGDATYVPGLLTVRKDELMLSQGLTARLLAVSERPVLMGDGTWSRRRFHRRPDGAATFPDPDGGGGFAYVSNSEEPDEGAGGVGAIYFDEDGNVIDYKMLLNGTTMNCGGGRTPWGTWVSNEEWKNGRAWQVDPYGRREPGPTQVGRDRGWWESFAYDDADPNNPQFFITEDQQNGALARFRPDPELVRNGNKNDPWSVLEMDGVVDYLVLDRFDSARDRGVFYWTTDRDRARASASSIYPNTEGIDVRDGVMYFVCKEIRVMFALDLAAGSWTSRSTRNGLFDGGPDQMQRIVGDARDMLYFTEEEGKGAGIHARDARGRFHVIVTSDELRGETTGLAFSPSGHYLFVAYQEASKVFMIWRRDGLPFQAEKLDVKYHHVP